MTFIPSGYFAVVTGMGGKDDKIEDIRNFEEKFFLNSQLCHQGVLNMSQCTTQNLSLSVSECFWKMVAECIDQQSDSFKAQRYEFHQSAHPIFASFPPAIPLLAESSLTLQSPPVVQVQPGNRVEEQLPSAERTR